MATPELCLVPAADVGKGGTFSASLGSLPWVFWWHTGTAMSRLHPFICRLLHEDVVECLVCKWYLCNEVHSVAFLCHKSAQLFLGAVQSLVCAAFCDEELFT